MKMNEVAPALNNTSTNKPQSPQKPGQQTNQRKERDLERKRERAIRPGNTVKLPTEDGKEQEFRITRSTGREVEIENPNGNGGPDKFVYDKEEIKKNIKIDDEDT